MKISTFCQGTHFFAVFAGHRQDRVCQGDFVRRAPRDINPDFIVIGFDKADLRGPECDSPPVRNETQGLLCRRESLLQQAESHRFPATSTSWISAMNTGFKSGTATSAEKG